MSKPRFSLATPPFSMSKPPFSWAKCLFHLSEQGERWKNPVLRLAPQPFVEQERRSRHATPRGGRIVVVSPFFKRRRRDFV
jgi:hypothetical protein